MIKILTSEAELKEALEKTRIFPDLLVSHLTIENKILNRFPEAKITVLLYENENKENLWIIIRETPWVMPFIILACRVEEKFDENVLFELFDEFAKMFLHVYDKELVVMGHELIIKQYEEWHKKSFHHFTNVLEYDYLYYSTEKQKQKFCEAELKLPEGYKFSEVDFQANDVEMICKTWDDFVARDGEIEYFRSKLCNMPYSLIRDENNAIVAYEMLEMSSLFHHQYVAPEHRGKGLGNIVERDLAKKCIQLGITPCKMVVTSNKNVVDSTERSPFWIRWNYNGKPIMYSFLLQEKIK